MQGLDTTLGEPEFIYDSTGSDTGIGSGSEGEEAGNAPDPLFQGCTITEPGRRASHVEVVDEVYDRNLYDLDSDVSDADDEESCDGAARLGIPYYFDSEQECAKAEGMLIDNDYACDADESGQDPGEHIPSEAARRHAATQGMIIESDHDLDSDAASDAAAEQ